MVVGFLPTLCGLLGAIGLTALAWWIGLCVVVQIGFRLEDGGERAVLAIAVGCLLLSYLAFGLGVCGLLQPAMVRLALGVVALATFVWRRQQRRVHRQAIAQAQPADSAPEGLPAWARGLLAVAALYLLALLGQCLSPPVDYDGLSYHLAAPKRWLELGAMRSLPTQIHSEWPMGFEMLYLLLLSTAGPFGCKPLVLFATMGVALAAYLLGRRLASPTVGALAAAICALLPGIDKINTTSIEMPLAYFTACSGLALARWRQAEDARQRRRWALLAGLCAGMACCTKLNGLLCAGVLALAALVLTPSDAKPLRRLRLPLSLLGVAVCCAAPWYVRAWLDTGNPIYPFAYRLLGGRDWNEPAERVLTAYFRVFNLPGATLAERNAVWHRHLLRGALLFLVGATLPSPRWVRGLAAAAGLFVVAQIWSSDQLRFFLPALPFAALVFGWWVVYLIQACAKLPFGRTAVPALGWSLTGIAALLALPVAGRAMIADLPALFSRQDQEASLHRNVINYEACLWANAHLPDTARVWMGTTSCSYFLAREVYWSSALVQQEITYDSPADCLAALQRHKIGYLMLDDGAAHQPSIQFEIGAGWRAGEWRCLQALAARSAPLWRDRHITIYQLPASDAQ